MSGPQAQPAVAPRSAQASAGDFGVLTWLLPFGLLVLAIVVVPLYILDEQGLPRYRALSLELEEVEAVNERLEHEVRGLEHEVNALRSDPRAIERIARDELGMVRDGELVFQF